MKTIIGGKQFNTETDKPIASKRIGRLTSNFGYIHEMLYRTENNEWYLHGVVIGYGNTSADISSGGEHIIPLNEKQVRKWLRRTGNTTALEEYFNRD